MAANIAWQLLQNPDYVKTATDAYKAGGQLRDDRTRRDVMSRYGTDPDGAITALAGVDPQAASGLFNLRTGQRRDEALRSAAPYLQQGDYTTASRTVAGTDPGLAGQLAGLGNAEIQRRQNLARRAGSVLMVAASLPPPQRPAFMAQHRQDAIDGGLITAEDFDAMDWAGMPDDLYRSYAGQALDVEKLFGSIATGRVGDDMVTTRDNPLSPTGGGVVRKEPIPETRAEREAREQNSWNRDRTDRQDTQAGDRWQKEYELQSQGQEDARTRDERNTDMQLAATVLAQAKARATANGGEITFLPEEQAILNRITARWGSSAPPQAAPPSAGQSSQPMSGGSVPSQPGTADIAYLKANAGNPAIRERFERRFGPGSASRALQ